MTKLSGPIRAANDNLADDLARWEAETRGPFLSSHPERRDPFVTQALGWPIKPLYTPADLEAVGFDYRTDLGFPGEYPYTRSTKPNGHRSQFWTMTQVTGFGKGQAWAKRARYMLDQGLSGLILEYDLATTNGYDSDDPMVEGEVGRAGMALDSLEDLEAAFDLPFDRLKYLMSVCNAPQPVNLAMIIAALEKKGVDPRDFVLHIVNGILIEYTCVGRYIYPPEHGLRIAADCIEYIIRNHPNWAPLSIIAAQLQPAKANPVQEIAFSLAIACAYIDATLARGLTIDEVAPYMNHFVVNVDMDFFEGICKLRAFRKCWARLMKERYGATSADALKIRLMTSPTTIALTLQQPLNNIARLGIMATACALGGALKAIERGYFQSALGREQYERNRDLEEGRRKWVGVNHLTLPEEKREIEIFRLDDAMEEEQVAKVRALRARRDQPAVDAALDKVREAARNGGNLVPVCLDAVRLYATHGELCAAMRDVFGTHAPDAQLAGV